MAFMDRVIGRMEKGVSCGPLLPWYKKQINLKGFLLQGKSGMGSLDKTNSEIGSNLNVFSSMSYRDPWWEIEEQYCCLLSAYMNKNIFIQKQRN